jgi:hypothetical protein
MGNDPAESSTSAPEGQNRRKFIRNMAIAAAVVPVVTVLDVKPAAALSPPPSSSESSTGTPGGGTTDVAAGSESQAPTQVEGIQVTANQTAAGNTNVAGTELARTGADIDKMTTVAAAALVAGAGALGTGQYLERRRAAVEGTDSQG